MTQEIVNVVCMKWGNKYNAQDVNILFAMVQRHLSKKYRFICFTDDHKDINTKIECFDLPVLTVPQNKEYSPWKKLGMFSPNLEHIKGKILFLDLDIVIIDDIDCFFDYANEFTIIENWTQLGQAIGNSSVYCFEYGNHHDVYEYYCNNIEEVTSKYSNEQIYLSRKIGKIKYWPQHWCKSFKRHCLQPQILRYFMEPKQPIGAKIIVFHGNPKPSDAIKGGFFGNIFKYTKPAHWLAEYYQD
jgi:hypothetical protein